MATKLVVKGGVCSAANVASCYMVVFSLALDYDLPTGYRKIMKHLQEIFTFHFHPGRVGVCVLLRRLATVL